VAKSLDPEMGCLIKRTLCLCGSKFLDFVWFSVYVKVNELSVAVIF
jgi:hypothetical protein